MSIQTVTIKHEHAHLMSETELQGIIVRMAEAQGWLVHTSSAGSQNRPSRPARHKTQNGFPDVVCARDGELLLLELKTQDGGLKAEQIAWAMALPSNSGSCRYEVIRPSDLARGRVDELLA